MALYYSVGRTLVPSEELAEKRAELGKLARGELTALTFRTGSVVPEALVKTFSLPGTSEPQAFQEIGLGQPLTIRIASAYPGDLPPKSGLFGRKRGVLITSAVKSWQTFDMQPRALNILKKEVAKKTSIEGPAATEDGTPLVFYSPALTDRSLILTFEMAIDNVDEDLYQGVGRIFQSAAGLPIFASASPYLLAASALFRVGGAIANALFDSRAEFQGTENIFFDVPGESVTRAGFALVTRSRLDEQTLQNFAIVDGELVEKTTNTHYNGALPCVVIALDGTNDTNLESFSATAASAALLKQFYNVRENGETSADALVDALKFYNDFRFEKEALKLKARLKTTTVLKERDDLQKRIDAVTKNIQTDEFKQAVAAQP